MTTTTTTTTTSKKAPKVKPATAVGQKSTAAVTAIEPIVQVAATTSTVTTTAAAPSKADKARAIFAECRAMAQMPQRKDIINRFVAEAGLTKAGAATYLQNLKTKAGLVVPRTASTPASV